jgi:hypothetical protein
VLFYDINKTVNNKNKIVRKEAVEVTDDCLKRRSLQDHCQMGRQNGNICLTERRWTFAVNISRLAGTQLTLQQGPDPTSMLSVAIELEKAVGVIYLGRELKFFSAYREHRWTFFTAWMDGLNSWGNVVYR